MAIKIGLTARFTVSLFSCANSDIEAVDERLPTAYKYLRAATLYVDLADTYYKSVQLSDLNITGEGLPTYPLLLGAITSGSSNDTWITRLQRDSEQGFTVIFNKQITGQYTLCFLISTV